MGVGSKLTLKAAAGLEAKDTDVVGVLVRVTVEVEVVLGSGCGDGRFGGRRQGRLCAADEEQDEYQNRKQY